MDRRRAANSDGGRASFSSAARRCGAFLVTSHLLFFGRFFFSLLRATNTRARFVRFRAPRFFPHRRAGKERGAERLFIRDVRTSQGERGLTYISPPCDLRPVIKRPTVVVILRSRLAGISRGFEILNEKYPPRVVPPSYVDGGPA